MCGAGALWDSGALESKREGEIEAVVSGVCALQAKIVEEIPVFMFRIKSLSKMYWQKN